MLLRLRVRNSSRTDRIDDSPKPSRIRAQINNLNGRQEQAPSFTAALLKHLNTLGMRDHFSHLLLAAAKRPDQEL